MEGIRLYVFNPTFSFKGFSDVARKCVLMKHGLGIKPKTLSVASPFPTLKTYATNEWKGASHVKSEFNDSVASCYKLQHEI